VKLRRAAIGETNQSDGKRVWHKGEGVDLLTWVNFLGRATKHEITFPEGYVQWNRGQGVRTGRDSADGDKAGGKMRGSTLQSHDGTLDTELVRKALAIAEENTGDKYLEHLAVVLRHAVDPQAGPYETAEVTRARPAKPEKPQGGRGFIAKLFGSRR
jgi:hypothetical protein